MSTLLPVLVGAGASLSGAGLGSAIALMVQKRTAGAAARQNRLSDVRTVLDQTVEALIEAQFRVLLVDIRVQAVVAGHDLGIYLEAEAEVNAALVQVRAAGARLAIRSSDVPSLLGAHRAAHDALLAHRDSLGDAVRAHAVTQKMLETRGEVTTTVEAFESAAERRLLNLG